MIESMNYVALIAYIFSISVTPGPNNIMLAASGANHGYKKTLPHLMGITSGVIFMLILCALGIGMLFTLYPNIRYVLFIIGSAYLLWLAYKIARAKRADNHSGHSEPFSFLMAMSFQLVNPKAWFMTINVVVLFSLPGENYISSIVYICIMMIVVNFPSISLWAGLGMGMSKLLKTNRAWRVYNLTMAGILVACIPLMLWK